MGQEGEKFCPKCKKYLPATTEFFHSDKHIKCGLTSQCKLCRTARTLAYNKTLVGRKSQKTALAKRVDAGKTQAYERKRGLKRYYGLSLDDYDRLLDDQGGVCAICGGTNKNGYRLYVDHDHRTNKVRALLCSHCNTLLGAAREDMVIVCKALNYLIKYNS